MKRSLSSRTPTIRVSLGAQAMHRGYLVLALLSSLAALATAGYLANRVFQAEARITVLEQEVMIMRDRDLPEGHANEPPAITDAVVRSEPDSGPRAGFTSPHGEIALEAGDPATSEIPEPAQDAATSLGEPDDSSTAAEGRPLPANEPVADAPAAPEAVIPAAEEAPSKAPGGGPWAINLVSYYREEDAKRFLEKAQALEIPAESVEIKSGNKPVWRLKVSGFQSAAEASDYGEAVKHQLGLASVWVSRD